MTPGRQPANLHLVLTGPMGSGKTTVGAALALHLGRPFLDSDAQIEREYGTTARMLAEERGVEWLHEAEGAALGAALDTDHPAVIAAAASVAEYAGLPDLLSDDRAILVLLNGDPAVLAARAGPGDHRRMVSVEEYARRSQRRTALLSPLVDVELDVTASPPEEIVESILRRCFGRKSLGRAGNSTSGTQPT